MRLKDKIIHEISRVARQLFDNQEGHVYLYGSQARNEATSDSDWDLLVITDDDSAGQCDYFTRYAFPFAEIGWRFGTQITPIHFTRSEWEAQRNTAFFLNVTSEAIKL